MKKTIDPIPKPAPDVKKDSEKMLKHTLEVFKAMKEGYIRKQKNAAIVIDKVYQSLDQVKQEQLQQLDNILATKEEMVKNLHRISSKYDQVVEKQTELSSRIDSFSLKVVPRLQLTQAERLMKTQLLEIQANCEKYKDSLRQLQARHEYASSKVNSSLIVRQQLNLDDSYVETISTLLDRQSDSIFDLVRRVNKVKIILNQESNTSSPMLSSFSPKGGQSSSSSSKTVSPNDSSKLPK